MESRLSASQNGNRARAEVVTTFRITATIEFTIDRADGDIALSVEDAAHKLRGAQIHGVREMEWTEIHAHRVPEPPAPPPPPRQPPINHEVAPEEVLLTSDQATEFLNVGSQTLAQWRSKGGGPTFLRYGRRVMYRKSDLLAWLAEREYQNTSQPRR